MPNNAKTPQATITREKLIDLLNEDLCPRVSGHHRLRELLAGPQGRGLHEHRRRARRPRHRRARPRHHHRQATSTISAACPPSHPSPSRPPRRPRTCSASISKTRRRPSRQYRRRVKQCDELNEFAIERIHPRDPHAGAGPPHRSRHRPRHRPAQSRHRRLVSRKSEGPPRAAQSHQSGLSV